MISRSSIGRRFRHMIQEAGRPARRLPIRAWSVLSGAALCLAIALPSAGNADAPSSEPPVAVVSFSVLQDLVASVAGSEAEVRGLTPIGAEVHEWELSPRNFMDLEGADIVFYNGLGLEQWVNQIREAVGEDTVLVPVAERVDRARIPIDQGDFAGTPDPHMWMDPNAGAQYAAVIRDALADLAPDRVEAYARNAEALRDTIQSAREEAEALMACIPAQSRVLVTSEAAFLYFAEAFGFEHAGIWGSNAEVEGSPEQLMRVIDLIEDRRPSAIFWESTISDRHVQGVADDTGVPVSGPLYVDSLGPEGSGAESYAGLFLANARLLRDALGEGCAEEEE